MWWDGEVYPASESLHDYGSGGGDLSRMRGKGLGGNLWLRRVYLPRPLRGMSAQEAFFPHIPDKYYCTLFGTPLEQSDVWNDQQGTYAGDLSREFVRLEKCKENEKR